MSRQVETRVNIYVIRPILAYGAETMSETTKMNQQRQTIELRTLRKIGNKTRLHRTIRMKLRERC